MNSEPLIEKKGTPASPATALASKRLARSGGAHQQHALGDSPAEPLEFLRVFEEFDDLFRSCLTPSSPATSANVIGLRVDS